jgi:hypothetical protein
MLGFGTRPFAVTGRTRHILYNGVAALGTAEAALEEAG